MAPSEDVESTPTVSGAAPGAGTRVPPKMLLVVVSVLADFLMTGITYGYSGIVPVLTMQTKAFASSCLPGEALPCDGQIRSLSAAFTLSVSTVSASGVPVGLLLDAVGPRYTTIIGSFVFSLGLVAFAAAPGLADQLYYWGFFLLSLGGPAVITSTMNFADLFPSVSSAIISAQNGAFDASSAVMFLMGKAVTAFGVSLGFVMLSYLSVPLALIVIAALFFPDKPFGFHHEEPSAESSEGAEATTSGPKQTGELWRLYFVKSASVQAKEIPSEDLQEPLLPASSAPENRAESSSAVVLPPDVHNSDISIQLKSTVFWVLVFVSSYLVTRSNFYIASIYQQLLFAATKQQEDLPGDEGAVVAAEAIALFYTDIFNYIMPIGGAMSVLLSGWFMVKLGLTSTFTFIGAMCCTVSTLQYFAVDMPLEVQVGGFVVFAVLRAFIFGAIAAFLGQIFGFRNFGRLFGISRVAGAIVTIIQYPLIHLAETTFDGDYRTIDLGFLAFEILLTIGYPLYLWKGVFYGYFFIPPVRTTVPPSN